MGGPRREADRLLRGVGNGDDRGRLAGGSAAEGRGTLKRTLTVNANPNESSWNPACGCVPPTAAPLPNGVKRSHDPIVCDEPLAPLPVIAKCGKEPIKNVLVRYSPNSGEFEVSWGVRGRAFRNCAVPSGPPLLPVRIRLNPDDIPPLVGKSRKVIKLNPTFKPVPMQRDGVARVTKLHWRLSVTVTRIR